MREKSYISTLEQKLLVGFVLFFSLLFVVHFAEFKIEKYNADVKSEQIELREKADPPGERISFSICTWGQPLIVSFYWLNLFLIPLINFLLRQKRFSLFVFSALITFFTVISSFYWSNFNYSSNLLTNILALSTLIAFSSLLILQIAVIIRFAFEKFQARISLR